MGGTTEPIQEKETIEAQEPVKRGRGRPSLSPEEKERRRLEREALKPPKVKVVKPKPNDIEKAELTRIRSAIAFRANPEKQREKNRLAYYKRTGRTPPEEKNVVGVKPKFFRKDE